MKKQINNLELLLAEKKKLKEQSKIKLGNINREVDYLRQNFSSIIFKSISPFKSTQTDRVADILHTVNSYLLNKLPVAGIDKNKAENIMSVLQMAVAGFVYQKVKSVFTKKTGQPDNK